MLTRPKFRRYLTLDQVRDYVLWLHDHAAEVSEELPWDVVQGVTADPDDDYIAGVAYLGQDVRPGSCGLVGGGPGLFEATRRVRAGPPFASCVEGGLWLCYCHYKM